MTPVYNPDPGSVLAPIPDPRTVHLLKHKNEELLKIKGASFLGLFSEMLVINEKTVSIIKQEFLSTSCETLPVKDIGRVIINNTMFSASLTIIGKNTAHQLEIASLPKQKAQEAKNLMEGLLLEEEGLIEIPPYLEPEAHKQILEVTVEQEDSGRISYSEPEEKHPILGTLNFSS